jgi:hypothetical protein
MSQTTTRRSSITRNGPRTRVVDRAPGEKPSVANRLDLRPRHRCFILALGNRAREPLEVRRRLTRRALDKSPDALASATGIVRDLAWIA